MQSCTAERQGCARPSRSAAIDLTSASLQNRSFRQVAADPKSRRLFTLAEEQANRERLGGLVPGKGTSAVHSGNMLVVADVPQSDVVHWVRGLDVAQTAPYSLELMRGQR